MISSQNRRRLWRGLIERSLVGGMGLGILMVLEPPLRHLSTLPMIVAIFGTGLGSCIILGIIMGGLSFGTLRHFDRQSSECPGTKLMGNEKALKNLDSEPANLRIRRDWQYVDSLRKYHIIVDGEQFGDVWAESELSVPVSPGSHTIQFRMDWVGSPAMTLFSPGQVRTLLVTSKGAGPLNLYYVTFGCREYLSVEEVSV